MTLGKSLNIFFFFEFSFLTYKVKMAMEGCVNFVKFLSFCGKLVSGESFIYTVERTALQVLGEFLWAGPRLKLRLKACSPHPHPGTLTKGNEHVDSTAQM
jgi:hypothetical protein